MMPKKNLKDKPGLRWLLQTIPVVLSFSLAHCGGHKSSALFSSKKLDATSQNATATPTDGVSNGETEVVSNAAVTEVVSNAQATTGVVNVATKVNADATLASIAVTPANVSLPAGLTQQYTANGTYSDGTTVPLTNVTWSSTNPSAATVSNGSDSRGLATALVLSSTSIKATLNGVSGIAALEVIAPNLKSITVAPALPSVAQGSTRNLTATGLYTDATSIPLTDQVTWSSASPDSATISNAAGSKGLVTPGATIGDVVMKAALGTVFGTTVVKVTPPPVCTTISKSNLRILGEYNYAGTIGIEYDAFLQTCNGAAISANGKYIYFDTKNAIVWPKNQDNNYLDIELGVYEDCQAGGCAGVEYYGSIDGRTLRMKRQANGIWKSELPMPIRNMYRPVTKYQIFFVLPPGVAFPDGSTVKTIDTYLTLGDSLPAKESVTINLSPTN